MTKPSEGEASAPPPESTPTSTTGDTTATAASPGAAAASTSSPPAGSAAPADQPIAAAIAVDEGHETANDEGIESDAASSTASLSESVLQFRKLHGRTYHNFSTGTEYWGPNDERQNEHLDINHEMLLLAMQNKLYYAPIGDDPQKVLDVGTGTGIWAVDFADQFPSAEVIGTDISPIQPAWVPPNCKFELDDAQQEWTYPDNHFDFIHIRLMMGAITDWPALYRQIHRCLKPGGWFEHMDYNPNVVSDDGSLGPDSAWHRWGPLFVTAGEKLGRTFSFVVDHENVGWMEDAGFENVQEKRMKLPLGSWPAKPELKTVGHYNQCATEQGLEGFALYILTHTHGWDLADTQIYLSEVRKEMRNRSNHAYYEASAVFGQKPRN